MKKTLLFFLTFLLGINIYSQDDIYRDFLTPTKSRPYTWWHWLNGYVTKEGIDRDLESMKKMGLDGFTQFTVGLNVNLPTMFNIGSKEYYEMVNYTFKAAKKNDLEVGFNNASGWSSTGGPWVDYEHSMKTMIWSSREIVGGGIIKVLLDKPSINDIQKSKQWKSDNNYYGDIAVIAIKTPENKNFKVKDWECKSLMNNMTRFDGFVPDDREAPDNAKVPLESIVVISDCMDNDGCVEWNAPAGNWTILRFGYTTTGAMVRPGSIGGIGLEVDKLNKKAVDIHWNEYISKMINQDNGYGALKELLIDSYEVGMCNWTYDFDKEFYARRGYDFYKVLPAVAGYVVNDVRTTERLLWDFRVTVSELMKENYFEYIKKKCHERSICYVTEPYGTGTFDSPSVALLSDIPMTEFWAVEKQRNIWKWTAKIVASSAHLSGKSIVGAEAFTHFNGDWSLCPKNIKKCGDWAFLNGVNRFYFHTFAHQPWDEYIKPGLTMGPFGGNFHRNNTWFMKSASWMDYISRCQYIMQKGTYKADILILYADELGFYNFLTDNNNEDVKEYPGFKYDLGGMSSLKDLFVDNDGNIRVKYKGTVLDVSYKMLVLRNSKYILPDNLELLTKLADKGAVIFADSPCGTPSYTNSNKADEYISNTVNKYWREGIIKETVELEDFLKNITPDCVTPKGVEFNKHEINGIPYYFISNQSDEEMNDIRCSFRVTGRKPEIWDPVSGKKMKMREWYAKNGQTNVMLDLPKNASLFIVFNEKTNENSFLSDKVKAVKYLDLNNDWNVQFDCNGQKKSVTFNSLLPWNMYTDDNIRYYSGSAVYKKDFNIRRKRMRLELNLGDVDIMAKVKVNGQDMGTLWTYPFKVDITDAVKSGKNIIEIEVTNVWKNKIIGDKKNGKFVNLREIVDNKSNSQFFEGKTSTLGMHITGETPLLQSGLIGPVAIYELLD